MGAMALQITSLTIVYSTIYSGADQRKHQRSASLAFVRGIERWPVNSPHKGPVTRKMFTFDYDIMGYHVIYDSIKTILWIWWIQTCFSNQMMLSNVSVNITAVDVLEICVTRSSQSMVLTMYDNLFFADSNELGDVLTSRQSIPGTRNLWSIHMLVQWRLEKASDAIWILEWNKWKQITVYLISNCKAWALWYLI